LAGKKINRSRPITVEEVRMRYVVAPFVVATFLLAASIAPSHAQVDSREGIALQNQIYQLRQELTAAENQMARGGGGSPAPAYAPTQLQGDSTSGNLVAQLLTRVDALEDQVRQLRGRLDEMQNQLQQQNADLGKRIDDLAFQVNPQGAQQGAPQGTQPGAPQTQQLGSGAPSPDYPPQGPAPTQLGAPPSARPAAASAPRTPEIALQEGRADLARRDYPRAEAAAREVLANRTSPRAYDARLLLAQALSGERQYAQAAIAFDDAYNSSRKGAHAQDALLGLADSLSAINEKKAACDSLARLRAEFPKARPEIAADAAAAARKTGCR
jgi:TolA-binding protein